MKFGDFFKRLTQRPLAKTAPTSPARPTTEPETQTNIEAPLRIKLNIGSYTIEPFTEGGICAVGKGIPDDSNNPILAVKMVRQQWLNHSAVRRQFSNESQIVKELSSPRLPVYRSRGLVNGQAYYAYDFIKGFQLINISQQRDRFPPEVVNNLAADFVRQLLEQLHYLHDRLKPIVHGDISSENILIDDAQHIYLVDFGCAHFLKQANRESYQWIAKPSFISPEQAKGEIWDHRSDLYQAGILFYELATGKRWNTGETKRDKILYAASDRKLDTRALEHRASNDHTQFIQRLLEPNPDNRYQTAQEALDALAQCR